jgi:hypothetical protein
MTEWMKAYQKQRKPKSEAQPDVQQPFEQTPEAIHPHDKIPTEPAKEPLKPEPASDWEAAETWKQDWMAEAPNDIPTGCW